MEVLEPNRSRHPSSYLPRNASVSSFINWGEGLWLLRLPTGVRGLVSREWAGSPHTHSPAQHPCANCTRQPAGPSGLFSQLGESMNVKRLARRLPGTCSSAVNGSYGRPRKRG